jgi:hypothetical protein
MKRSPLQLIALAASAIICVQNLPVLTAIGWALLHGAGLLAVLAFAPAAIALAVLWGGYRLITSRVSSPATVVFAMFAIAVVVANELLLPATPLKGWVGQGALEGVRVLKVRDEPLLSSRGNPIGVRISFDAVVPRTGPYSISASTLASASGETIWPLHFGHMLGLPTVQPEPTNQSDSPYDVFQKDVVYTFVQDMLPGFIRYDEKTKTPCLAEVRTKYITEADFLSALAANRDIRLRTSIQVDGEHNAVSVVAAEAVTSRAYDMQAIYDTIAKEDGGRCAQ